MDFVRKNSVLFNVLLKWNYYELFLEVNTSAFKLRKFTAILTQPGIFRDGVFDDEIMFASDE